MPHESGSVDVKVRLDYSDFKTGIENMRNELNSLQSSLNSMSYGKALSTMQNEFKNLSTAIKDLGSQINNLKNTISTVNGAMDSVSSSASATSESLQLAGTRLNQLGTQYQTLAERSSMSGANMIRSAQQVNTAVQEEANSLLRLEEAYMQVIDVDYSVISSTIEIASAFQEEAIAAGEAATEVGLLANEQRLLGTSGAASTAAEMGQVASSASTAGASMESYGNKASVARDRVNELDKASGLLRRTLSLLVVTAGFELVTEIGQATWSMINAREATRSFAQMCGWSSSEVESFVDKGRQLQTTYTKIDMSQVTQQVAQLAHQYNLSESAAEGMIETSAVFTAAMAREGRSAEDATLALKDYYDQGTGWARRMQEVGVTEEKLKATGLWNGQKDDIEGMNAALGEVLRQMNIYEEAMNVNSPQEAWESLKIVIAEVGAEIFELFSGDVTTIMKGVVWLVIQLHNAISGIKEWFNGLDEPWQMFIHWLALTGAGTLAAVIGIRKLIGPVTRLVAAFKEWKNLSWFEKIFGKGTGSSGTHKMEDKFPGKEVEKDVDETTQDVDRADKASKKFDKAEFKNKLKNMASKFALAGAAIGMTFALIGEVLLGIWVTLWALGEVGKQYQRYKPQIQLAIQAMIEIGPILILLGAAAWGVGLALDKLNVKTSDILKMGLKSGVAIGATFTLIAEILAGVYVSVGIIAGIGSIDTGLVQNGVDTLTSVAPILIILAGAVSLVMVAMSVFNIQTGQITKAFKPAAVGIAAVLILVAESIVMLIPSIIAIMGIGYITDWLGGAGQLDKGVEAIRLLGEVFNILRPYILGFIIAAVAMGVIIDATGGVGLEVLMIGIAGVMVAVAEGIALMILPLGALAAVGWVADVVGDYADKGVAAIEGVIDAIGRIADAIIDTVYEVLMNAITKITLLAQGLANMGNTLSTLAPSISSAAVGVGLLQGALFLVSNAFMNITLTGAIDGLIQWASDILGIDGFENIKQAINKIADLARAIVNSNIPDPGSILASATSISAVANAVPLINSTARLIIIASWGLPSVDELNQAEIKIITALKCILNLGNQLNQTTSGSGGTSNISSITSYITQLVTTLRNGVNQILALATLYTVAGMRLGTALATGLIAARGQVGQAGVLLINQAIVSVQNRYGTFYNAGRASGMKVSEGLRTGMSRMQVVARAELDYTLNAINGYYQKFYNAGHRLGEAETKGYQDGQDMHSPGIIARSTAEEMQRVEDYILEAVPVVENAAYQLGSKFSTAYSDNMSIDGANPNLSNAEYGQIQANAMTLTNLTNQATTTAMTDFTTLQNGMSGTFNQMGTDATNTFQGITTTNQQYLNQLNTTTQTGMKNAANTTKTQLNQMRQSTTDTVSKMNNAWNLMRNNIVNAATSIRTQSYNKFSSLHRSISSFYNQLASAHFTAGLASGPSRGHNHVRIGEYGGNTGGRIRNFGSKLTRKIHPSTNSYGGLDTMSNSRLSRLYLALLDNPNPALMEQLRLLGGDPNAYYGTVSSNYQRIKNTVDQYSVADPYFLGIRIPMNNHVYDWEDGKTKRIDASNFEEILSMVLTARGFRNPGTYSYYANSMKSNQQVWDSLSCNCYDGAEVIAEIGQMLGLGGTLVHGSWKGEGHMAAMVAGKIYDMTQFQKHGVFRGTPGVVFGPSRQSKVQRNTYGNTGTNGNRESINTGNVTVNIDMSNTTVYGDDSFIDRMKQMITDEIYKAQMVNRSTGL